jgi:hypothetical protein
MRLYNSMDPKPLARVGYEFGSILFTLCTQSLAGALSLAFMQLNFHVVEIRDQRRIFSARQVQPSPNRFFSSCCLLQAGKSAGSNICTSVSRNLCTSLHAKFMMIWTFAPRNAIFSISSFYLSGNQTKLISAQCSILSRTG